MAETFCVGCIHFKEAVDGVGKCKKVTPTTHFTMAENKMVRRDNGWAKVKTTDTSCASFEAIP